MIHSLVVILLCIVFSCVTKRKNVQEDIDPVSKMLNWYRPVNQPVFSKDHGNNHDPVLFIDHQLDYPYQMIISHTESAAFLWKAHEFSWNSADWKLVSDEYVIGDHYEYDDGLKVNGTYYIYENGIVYTYSGSLESGNGQWKKSGSFPVDQCDDIGVFYEDGIFHIFGEYGDFPHGPDGSSLSHFRSSTGVGDWEIVDTRAVDPNPDGGAEFGVGDATITKVNGEYYLFCDRETKELPYRIVAWKSTDINEPFRFLDVVIQPRSEETGDWDNHRIQDGDIGFIPEKSRFVMVCNMKDLDGEPGYSDDHTYARNHLKGNETRVIGTFYMDLGTHK